MNENDRKNSFIAENNKRAKDIVLKSYEVMITLIILLVQYINCNVTKVKFINPIIQKNDTEVGPDDDSAGNIFAAISTVNKAIISDTNSFYQCVLQNLHLLEPLKWIGLAIAVCNVLFAAVVWTHSAKLNRLDIELTATTEKVHKFYGCTNRIPLIDSIIEIPFALYLAPKTTILLWLLYVLQLSGICIMMFEFIKYLETEEIPYDKSAVYLSSYFVAYNIFRLTGDTSQYFVINLNASNDDNDETDTVKTDDSKNKLSDSKKKSTDNEIC